MDEQPYQAAEQVLPHRSPMILIEKVKRLSELSAQAVVDVSATTLFLDEAGNLPSWVGIELMAQTASAYAGLDARSNNLPPRIGYLLGTRKYLAYVDAFQGVSKLVVAIEETYRDESNIAIFDCKIRDSLSNQLLAEAQIKAIEPNSDKPV